MVKLKKKIKLFCPECGRKVEAKEGKLTSCCSAKPTKECTCGSGKPELECCKAK